MAEVTNPFKMTDDIVKKLEEVFALDGTVEEACFWAGISKQTYYNWIDSFPEIKERFDAIRQRPFLKARQTIIASLDDPAYAFKYMEKKKKDEFGNAPEVSVNINENEERLNKINELIDYVKASTGTINNGTDSSS